MYVALTIGGRPVSLAVSETASINKLQVSENGKEWSLNGYSYPTGSVVRDRNPAFEFSVMGVFNVADITHLRALLEAYRVFGSSPRTSPPEVRRGINFADILRP